MAPICCKGRFRFLGGLSRFFLGQNGIVSFSGMAPEHLCGFRSVFHIVFEENSSALQKYAVTADSEVGYIIGQELRIGRLVPIVVSKAVIDSNRVWDRPRSRMEFVFRANAPPVC